MNRSRLVPFSVFLLFSIGCQLDGDGDPKNPTDESVTAASRAELTVDRVRRDEGCTTSVVNALSRQLIDEINCLRPNTLVDFRGPNMNLGNAVFPFLQGQGPRDLQAAIEARGSQLRITSALRTLPQQYLLYSWWRAGLCGISRAARPGNSRHESGLSIDIDDYAAWRPVLEGHNFDWLGSGDPVHFDYSGPGTVDLRGLSIRAFQRLWNRNNPGDQIVEDGIYGPQTEGRIRLSPSGGFAIGGCEPEVPVELDMAVPPPRPEDMSVPRDMRAIRDMSIIIDARQIETDAGSNQDVSHDSSDMDNRNDARPRPVEYANPDTLDSSPPLRPSNQSDAQHVGGCAYQGSNSSRWYGLLVLCLLGRGRRRHKAR